MDPYFYSCPVILSVFCLGFIRGVFQNSETGVITL